MSTRHSLSGPGLNDDPLGDPLSTIAAEESAVGGLSAPWSPQSSMTVEPVQTTQRFSPNRLLLSVGPVGISALFHCVVFVISVLVTIPHTVQQQLTNVLAELYEEELDDEILKVELDKEIDIATEMSIDVVSASIPIGALEGGLGSAAPPQLDQKIVEQLDGVSINIGPPNLSLPSERYMIEQVPDGALGDERFVAQNVDQAMSQITQELIVLLEKSPVLVVWLFDMSPSMEDDREEIRKRVEQIYAELGFTGETHNDRLSTAVASYGNGFFVNTSRGPTSDIEEIRAAIAAIKSDESGIEMMCQSLGAAVNRHRALAARQKRQLVVILVTDESGEPENNNRFLERAIGEAKSADGRIYVMGRESAFGYPHVRFLWRDPATKRRHHIPIDRGPETAFPEQLLIDGFSRRWNVFASGFGPYPLTRMARETGGVFFILPTEETAQRGFVNAKYTSEAMRSYKPDLRAKIEVLADRETYPLRRLINKVAQDLNPFSKEELELRRTFSLKPKDFVIQARQNQSKARKLLLYMSAAEKDLLENQRLREQEVSPRWQANYDLMLAQLVTYQVRVYEYGIYLQWVMKNPRKDPLVKDNQYLVNYDLRRRKETFAENEKLWKEYPDREKVLEYIARGKQLMGDVASAHSGTPWAAIASWELGQGFGVELIPDYDIKYDDSKKPTPRPKDPS